jgi:hypothetical protein
MIKVPGLSVIPLKKGVQSSLGRTFARYGLDPPTSLGDDKEKNTHMHLSFGGGEGKMHGNKNIESLNNILLKGSTGPLSKSNHRFEQKGSGNEKTVHGLD